MLSAEQLELRQRGVGASEVAAILGLDDFCTELDVWRRKRRGPDGELAPIDEPTPPPEPRPDLEESEAPPLVAGSYMEDAIAAWFEHDAGVEARRCGTRVHSKLPWAMATPDRLVRPPNKPRFDDGLECKLVGHHMKEKEWGDGADDYPEKFWIQCQWGMFVTKRSTWNLAALVDNRFVRRRIDRDSPFIEGARDVVGDWWERHVIGNDPPEPRDAADLRRMTLAQHALDNGKTLELNNNPELRGVVDPLVDHLMKLDRAATNLKRHREETIAKLEAICGPYRSMVNDRGRFLFASKDGPVSWKKIAEHVNGGPVPDEVLDQFRGKPYRRSQFYPFKKKGSR